MSQWVLQCPHCLTPLGGQSLPPAGTRVDCPQCSQPFVANPVTLAQAEAQQRAVQQARLQQQQQQLLLQQQQLQQPVAADPLSMGASAAARPLQSKYRKKTSMPPAAWVGIGGGGVLIVVLLAIIVFRGGGDASSPDSPGSPNSKRVSTEDDYVAALAGVGGAADSKAADSSNTNVDPTDPTLISGNQRPFRATTKYSHLPSLQMSPESVYNWSATRHYIYRLSITANGGPLGSQQVSGRIAYSPITHSAISSLKSTGTAFIVNDGGILATCAHVVEGAKSIKVTIESNRFSAEVVAIDDAHDLALLRVNATNLTAVPVGDSKRLKLAEDVRVIGFPISDILGTSVKVTRGSFVGLVNHDVRLLQVDATVNPGNSGGPMFNDRGEVMGVVTSGLFGSEFAEVGFCMPANDLRALMENNDIPFTPTGATAALDGPTLASHVVPAVAFVEVQHDLLKSRSHALRYEGLLNQDGEKVLLAGEIFSNSIGEVTNEDATGDEVDLIQQGIGSVLFQKMPRPGVRRWEANRVTTVRIPTPSRDITNSKFPVVERSISTVTVNDARTMRIERQYNATPVGGDATVAEKLPRGAAVWEFDKELEVPRMSQVLLSQKDGANQYEVTIRFELEKEGSESDWHQTVEGRALAQLKDALNDAAGRSKKSPYVRYEGLTNQQKVELALQVLSSPDESESNLRTTLEELRKTPAIAKYRPQISRGIESCLKFPHLAQGYISACQIWGTTANVPSIVEYMKRRTTFNEFKSIVAAFEACGPHPTSIAAVVGRMASMPKLSTYDDERARGLQMLISMKPASETLLHVLLTSSAVDEIRLMAIQILGAMGGEVSLDPLRKASGTNARATAVIKNAAKAAMKNIQARSGK